MSLLAFFLGLAIGVFAGIIWGHFLDRGTGVRAAERKLTHARAVLAEMHKEGVTGWDEIEASVDVDKAAADLARARVASRPPEEAPK